MPLNKETSNNGITKTQSQYDKWSNRQRNSQSANIFMSLRYPNILYVCYLTDVEHFFDNIANYISNINMPPLSLSLSLYIYIYIYIYIYLKFIIISVFFNFVFT